MITYDLQCSQGHTFEGWFADSQTYEQQSADGQVACPVCNDTAIERLLSTFSIRHSVCSSNRENVPLDPVRFVQAVAEFVRDNFDNVGPDFAREALKIHYGVCEPRNIRGSSTEVEEKMLQDEGIAFMKIPQLPASTNEASD